MTLHWLRLALALAAIGSPGLVVGQSQAPLAKIVALTADDGATTRTFFGHVVARETVDLAFQVGGQIVEFPVVEGESVPEGGLIAQLDLEPFQLSLDQAKVQQEQADRNLERLERLQGNTVSQVTVDDAGTQAQVSAIGVRNAQRSLDQATLTAPFDALVASRNIALFSTLSAGTPVVRLHDMSELRIEIDVPELLFQTAGENPDVSIFAEFPVSDTQYPLTVKEFNAETSAVGQTFRITLGMAPPDDVVVLPGSSVKVTATLRRPAERMVIPGSAVVTGNDGAAYAMVFAPVGADEGTVTRTPIEITPTGYGTVEVVSGLEDGQEIIASGAALLSDGATVRRFTGFSN